MVAIPLPFLHRLHYISRGWWHQKIPARVRNSDIRFVSFWWLAGKLAHVYNLSKVENHLHPQIPDTDGIR